ncbi:uncharacterized protein LOC116260084 isoform X2 [Nymphaea colorata]|uniref:uncharacterized protein LOC116260084 isoform X2 n=1 Tax=Nymphaea colorata TaxID=210225 RepID=UPI00129E5905|nr:uncharacterized protein LOC116260084 isoform X2 [Nymphaea colorata]
MNLTYMVDPWACFAAPESHDGVYLTGSHLVHSSTISDYDLGGDGDLFHAPEPIIGEPLFPLDPVIAAAISIPGTDPDEVLAQQTLEAATQLQSMQGVGPLMNDAFYEVGKDLFEKSAIDESFQAIPAAAAEEEDDATRLQKSVSTGCLNSTDWINGAGAGPVPPVFLDFQQLTLEEALGMRRAFSEGDIQALGNGNACSLIERPLIGSYTVEERKERLHRYRDKKTKRNFNRKIKYACRKALADSQPRVRGRFAKSEDSEFSKAHASASTTRPA